MASNQAMMIITSKKYIVDDAQKRREFQEYSTKIMQTAYDAKLSISLNILFLVYNRIDIEFQQDLLVFTAITSVNEFLQMMEEKKTV